MRHIQSTPARHFANALGALIASSVMIAAAGCATAPFAADSAAAPGLVDPADASAQSWKNANFSGPPLHKVLVVALQSDPALRHAWETAVVDALGRQHIAATASARYFPASAPGIGQLTAVAQAFGFDGVLTTRPGARTYCFDGSLVSEIASARRWRQRYSCAWRIEYSARPDGTPVDPDLRTDVVDLKFDGGSLIWSALSRGVDPSSAASISAEVRHIIPTLLRDRIVF